ncbi:glyoxalase family protein [Pilibacter termitis]|uniref:Glyoxalase family protein n=1 Tax=Pilibacter termitis TaxID=263852 RepID=A0A1T4MSR6_9ENTE|nr:ring-cleaving dioxygenase [Pilibacter termitis]SJZ69728.1 glyoxalase family protein [Pilibacter termitis]
MSVNVEINKNYQLGGLHHVTAITSNAQNIYEFFTNILGLRLAKKTVNQDDYQTFHLYFTDEYGAAGTDMTFFDFPNIPKGTKGTNNIDRVSFRVPTDKSVDYWLERFNTFGVAHGEVYDFFGKKAFDFEDFDEQHYRILSDENNTGMPSGTPWSKSNVDKQHAITGLGTVTVIVSNLEHMELVMQDVLGFHKTGEKENLTLYEIGEGGNGASILIQHEPEMTPAMQGYGNIHHLALRIKDQDGLRYWIERLSALRFPNSGFVDRFYFASEYARVAPQILFEIATDGPGFWEDEAENIAGEELSLPPHLFPGDEAVKAATAAKLRPLNTSDANKMRV